MLIEYKNKEVKKFKTPDTKGTVIYYEISEEDMMKLSELNNLQTYEERKFFLTKDYKIIDMIVDNLDTNRFIEGGIKDNKFILTYFIIEKGLELILQSR